MVEFVRLRNMPVERSGIELGQEINSAQAGVDAVGNGDIDEAIFTGERDSGFGAFFCERKQPCSLAPTHDNGEHVAGVSGLPSSM